MVIHLIVFEYFNENHHHAVLVLVPVLTFQARCVQVLLVSFRLQ